MRRLDLFGKYFLTLAGVALLCVFTVTRYAFHAIREFQIERTQRDLEAKIGLLLPRLPPDAESGAPAAVAVSLRALAEAAGARLTLILPDGRVQADTLADADRMERHNDRPEVAEALRGGTGRGTHFSATLLENRVYVAMPVRRDGRVVAVLRASVSIADLDATLVSTERHMALIGLLVALLAGLVGLYLSARISRPLRDMRAGAERFARGELAFRVAEPPSPEIAVVVRTMNEMAAQLDERIRSLERQRAETAAVLSSMSEGTIAVGPDEQILVMNRAAAEIFGTVSAAAAGRDIREVIRLPDVQQFVVRTVRGAGPTEAVLTLPSEPPRFLHAHGAPLRGNGGGAVVVFNDVTRLRRLETMRRDFVANVSHELKTPLTSISGFVETLLDGAPHSAEDTKRFLNIVARQVSRLKTLVDDLLELSRIEQEQERYAIETEEIPIAGVLQSAVQYCRPRADEKGVPIECACPRELRARINPHLVETAVGNLVENAVKYSAAGRTVAVGASADGGDLLIEVRDRGCGIESHHLPRLFERFYRVDKARSRAEGGTGLGLAIVKHIAQAHGGAVGVESTPGEGSRFWMRIPLAGPAREPAV